jgi:hypothetical protein
MDYVFGAMLSAIKARPRTGRMVVGYIAMLILILILAPMPHSLWDSASDVCPYL